MQVINKYMEEIRRTLDKVTETQADSGANLVIRANVEEVFDRIMV